MDRNVNVRAHVLPSEVATREGGVDRNVSSMGDLFGSWVVATREGGVDRNIASRGRTGRR